jgi:hypothetical protein
MNECLQITGQGYDGGYNNRTNKSESTNYSRGNGARRKLTTLGTPGER